MASGSGYSPNNNLYKSPIATGTTITVYSVTNAFSQAIAEIISGAGGGYVMDVTGSITVNGQEVSLTENTQYVASVAGTLTISYNCVVEISVPTGGPVQPSFVATYIIQVVSNIEPLPKWNAKTVVERALVVAETIRKSGTPRYKLNAEQAAILEKVETPEFQFTQSTLREVLQGVGSFIHAEPRLRGNEVYFDFYGGNEVNTASVVPYASLSVQQDIEQYCTSIDSSVDNLVNTLDYIKGTLTEPYASGYKTLRTETVYYMLSEANAEIGTQQKVQEVIKVECGFVGSETPPIDLTPYVYEEADYQRLSSYSSVYPGSKAYAIYYTQGENDIKGLFFKQDNPVSAVFSKYAILNILQAATGNSNLSIDNLRLAFRVTYRPIYSARVKQSKSYIKEGTLPRAKSYTQGQNLIEASYYGEHLKGVVARLGNVSKTITYVRPGVPELPKVGTLYNGGTDDYYISVVAAEFFPFVTKVTLALSQDFNRYSEYVGINSVKRMYEVSEKQAFDSHITYGDYVVIGDKVTAYSEPLYSLRNIAEIFLQNNDYKPITLLIAQGYDASNNAIETPIALPVMTAAMGNAVIFVSKFKDNYSAGDSITYLNYKPSGGDNNVDGYFVNSTPYCDVYGNIEYLKLDYYEDGTAPTSSQSQATIGDSLPSAKNILGSGLQISTGSDPLWIKKGSTEVPTIDYQIDFVTNRKNIIIGSGLAKNCPLVSGSQSGHGAVLYVLPRRLNKFERTVDLTGATFIYDYNDGSGGLYQTSGGIAFNARVSSVSGKSWVMVDKATNELLVGCNVEISPDMPDILSGLFITCTHTI